MSWGASRDGVNEIYMYMCGGGWQGYRCRVRVWIMLRLRARLRVGVKYNCINRGVHRVRASR